MTKAILKFDLTDQDDLISFKQAIVAAEALGALYNISSNIGYKFKHRDLTADQLIILDEIQLLISEYIEKSGVNLHELYT